MDLNGSEQEDIYQYAKYGKIIIFASWHLEHGLPFNSKKYDLTSWSNEHTMTTVVIRRSTMQWEEQMSFAIQCGIVHAAHWIPVPGTGYSRGWIRYYCREDAQKCYNELDDKQYGVGMTNVSTSFDTKASNA